MAQEPFPPEVPARTSRTVLTGVLQVVRLFAAEHTWEIAPGTIVRGYGYNGQAPGPTLEAMVGDTLLVRFTNSLSEATSICWPGQRRSGTTGVSRRSTPVPPGGTVELRVELTEAGTFAYHPDTEHAAQTERGLCGALVVRDLGGPVVDGERVLVLSDLKPFVVGRNRPTTGQEPGHDGPLLLINGVHEAQMQVTAGHRERWRLVNATVARRLRLTLTGPPHRGTGTRLGAPADPVGVQEVPLGRGERRDLIAGPFTAGERLTLHASCYPDVSGPACRHRIATVHVGQPASG